jgi:PhoH-like ATPase
MNRRGPFVLVTKDTNLRMKAKSLGLTAQDYSTDKVESMDKLYTGKRLNRRPPAGVLDNFSGNGHVPAEHLTAVSDPIANENFVLRNGSKSVLATYKPTGKSVCPNRPDLGVVGESAELRAVLCSAGPAG